MSLVTEPHRFFDAETRLQYADRLRLSYRKHAKTRIIPSTAGIFDEVTAEVLPTNEDETVLLIADLIDPDTCENAFWDAARFCCSKCGAVVPTNEVLVPDDSKPYRTTFEPMRYCPYCGRPIKASEGGDDQCRFTVLS